MMQRSWGRPAVVNLTLGGAGAGFYLLGVLLTILERNRFDQAQLVSFQLLAPAIVCFGFFALSLEAGRPSRVLHLLRNILSSWMSIESLAGALFIVATFTDWFYPHFVFKTVAVSAALILIISQGFMVYRAPAVTAWNVPLVPVIFAISGFMTACGLVLLNTLAAPDVTCLPAVISLIVVLLNLAVWLLYLYGYHNADFRRSTEVMRRFGSLMVTVGVGHLLPLVLLLSISLFGDFKNRSIMLPIVHVISGLAMIIGGASQKTAVILKAGYLRGIVLRSIEDEEEVTLLL